MRLHTAADLQAYGCLICQQASLLSSPSALSRDDYGTGRQEAGQGTGAVDITAAVICRLEGGYSAPDGLPSNAVSFRKNCSFNGCLPGPKTDKLTLIGGELVSGKRLASSRSNIGSVSSFGSSNDPCRQRHNWILSLLSSFVHDDSNAGALSLQIMKRGQRSHHFHGILPFTMAPCHMPQVFCFLIVP